ncbi:MAG TPA: PAS domain S-box protein, partial [Mesotoga infera]|nr:PAS domain S-box protein [Mesotoga infera]
MSAKILVVVDSTLDRFSIEEMLREYDVMTACDGLEAMSLIDKHEDIDLIILDLNIPGMDGFEVLAALKSEDRYKRPRTIILTDCDELDNEMKGLELGAVDYIRKPVTTNSLKVRIEIHLELLRIQQLLEQKVHEQETTFDKIFNQVPIGIAILHGSDPFDTNSNLDMQVNPMFEQITGRTKEELIKLGWSKITHPDDLREDMKNYRKYQSGETNIYSMEKRYVKPDGSIVWVHMTVAPFTLPGGRRNSQMALVQDITIRKTAETALLESERRKSALPLHMLGMAYRCNYDRDWTMQNVSAGCLELTGYPPESLINNRDLSFNDLIAPEYREPIWREWGNALKNRTSFKYEYQIVTAKGERKWVLEMREGLIDEQGKVEAIEGIIIDISDRKEFENTVRFSYEHDSWTGLYNRNYLEVVLESDASKRAAGKRAIVGINLGSVQSLTATYGFHYTQEVIKKIADTLTQFCTERHLLFIIYANQFAFYLKGYKDKNELTNFSIEVAKQLEPILLMERTRGGIGVVEIDEGNEKDVDLLLRRLLITSEKAIDLYHRDIGVCFYNEEIEKQMNREQEITLELAKISTEEEDHGL